MSHIYGSAMDPRRASVSLGLVGCARLTFTRSLNVAPSTSRIRPDRRVRSAIDETEPSGQCRPALLERPVRGVGEYAPRPHDDPRRYPVACDGGTDVRWHVSAG